MNHGGKVGISVAGVFVILTRSYGKIEKFMKKKKNYHLKILVFFFYNLAIGLPLLINVGANRICMQGGRGRQDLYSYIFPEGTWQ